MDVKGDADHLSKDAKEKSELNINWCNIMHIITSILQYGDSACQQFSCYNAQLQLLAIFNFFSNSSIHHSFSTMHESRSL